MGFDSAPTRVERAAGNAAARSWAGELVGTLEFRASRTIMARSHHRGPLRIQKLLYPESPARADVLLLHPPSGIASGDELSMRFHLKPGSAARFTTPGAGKWYRSCGPAARQQIDLEVEADASLEWLPQEAIVFDGAEAHSQTRIRCTRGARLFGWDIWMLGRRCSGETFRQGQLHLLNSLYCDDALLWRERAAIEAGSPLLDAIQGWDGYTVNGNAWIFGLGADDSLLEACRQVTEAGVHLGISRFEHGLWLVRALGQSAERVRRALTRIWQLTRPALFGADGVPPRIWAT